MPTYEYECLECKHKFDVFQSITAEPIKTCEKCDGNVRKLFGNAGIIFKGSGFYVNDYKNTKPAKSEACSSCPASEGGGCPSSKS